MHNYDPSNLLINYLKYQIEISGRVFKRLGCEVRPFRRLNIDQFDMSLAFSLCLNFNSSSTSKHINIALTIIIFVYVELLMILIVSNVNDFFVLFIIDLPKPSIACASEFFQFYKYFVSMCDLD
jgi:hypothetical protein